MPKMKTKKASAKRFSLTGTGKVKYKKMNLRHILTKKSSASSSFHTVNFVGENNV